MEPNSTSISKWCRICFNEFITGIFLFGKESDELLISVKIKKYLGIEISIEDCLSKMICEDCCKMLDNFHRFAIMALNNQEKMGKLLLPSKIYSCDETNGDKSLLHSYLTNSTDKPSVKDDVVHTDSEITEMEVRIDPMVILCGDEEINNDECDDSDDEQCQNNNFTSDSETEIDDENTFNFAQANTCTNNIETENRTIINENDFEISSKLISELESSNGFHCNICGKVISTKGNLKMHLLTHRPKGKYECDICRRIFKTQCNLHRHKEYHGGVQFPCMVCGRVYPTNSTLRAHSITHSDLRPHKCPLCEKTFKRNQDLKFHINQHTGARPYQCPYCSKAFASSGNCFSHRKRMHPLEVERDRGNLAKIIR